MDQNPPKHQALISGKNRISELPDPIICEILSFLPTKYAVATTILSKRWNNLWTYCSNFDISDSHLFIPRFPLHEATEDCFIKFVHDVITLNTSPCIKKFKFQSYFYYESNVITFLDSISRNRGVEEIEFDIAFQPEFPITLPSSLFTCQTLVLLEITSHANYDIPAAVHLPRLKVFRVNLYGPTNAVTTKLFCGLPVIEDLSISIHLFGDDKKMTLNIFTPTLKRLNLELYKDDGEFACYDYQIIVRAPGLKQLDIYDDIVANYVIQELPLDVKATLEIGMCGAEFEDVEHANRLIQVMNGISSAKSLVLSSYTLGTLGFCDVTDLVAVLPNLTYLEVDVSVCCGYSYLPYLIDRLPNLVFLVVKMVPAHETSRIIREPLEHVPQCLRLHLKKIEVKGFDGQEYELELLGYLLKDAQVLDEVVIYTLNIALEERKNLYQKLSSLTCGSKNCQLKILNKVSKAKKKSAEIKSFN